MNEEYTFDLADLYTMLLTAAARASAEASGQQLLAIQDCRHVDAVSLGGQAAAFSAAAGSYQKTLDYLEVLRRQDG